jgi:lauroyl/myristoyl acyltransferase
MSKLDRTMLAMTLALGKKYSPVTIRQYAKLSANLASTQWKRQDSHPSPEILSNNKNTLAKLARALNGGGIVSTFHVGSHLSIPWALAKSGLTVNLVVDHANYQPIVSAFDKSHSLTKRMPAHVRVIDAESQMGGLQILERLRRQEVVVVYADGNAGFSSNPLHRSTSISFFGLPACMRFGYLELAVYAEIGVHVVVDSSASRDSLMLKRLASFDPDSTRSPREFAESVGRRILRLLEKKIRSAPWLWEEWHQLASWVDLSSLVMCRDPALKNARMDNE